MTLSPDLNRNGGDFSSLSPVGSSSGGLGRMDSPRVLAPGAELGLVVDGSLTDGVEVRLNRETSVEDLKAGTFVTIQGNRGKFFGVLTGISLAAPTRG